MQIDFFSCFRWRLLLCPHIIFYGFSSSLVTYCFRISSFIYFLVNARWCTFREFDTLFTIARMFFQLGEKPSLPIFLPILFYFPVLHCTHFFHSLNIYWVATVAIVNAKSYQDTKMNQLCVILKKLTVYKGRLDICKNKCDKLYNMITFITSIYKTL